MGVSCITYRLSYGDYGGVIRWQGTPPMGKNPRTADLRPGLVIGTTSKKGELGVGDNPGQENGFSVGQRVLSHGG